MELPALDIYIQISYIVYTNPRGNKDGCDHDINTIGYPFGRRGGKGFGGKIPD
jgi:hypothetical protein